MSVGYEYEDCSKSIAWIHRLVRLEGHRANRFMLGGWSLSVHHHYDIVHSMYFNHFYVLRTSIGQWIGPLLCPL